MESSDNSKKGFFKHVFNFDNDSKSDILNIIQYTLIAIIPVVVLNKFMQKYVPEADEKKGSVEILAEVLIQTIVMFVGLLIIHRIITYVPTYSGMEYPEFSIIFIILAILMITLSLQTKLGEKVSILVDRITELWEGKPNNNGKNGKGKGNGNVKVSQPISGQQNMSMTMPMNTMPNNQSAMNQSLYGGSTSISQLPSDSSGQSYSQSTQQLPNYNNMYQQDNTPLVGAATPGMAEAFSEPMAANSVLGGGAFGSW
uniref:Uncharacterized protein n=1 Tax=viral metagenome TaxID=1070528 RepID=A0A6C0JHR9_9ZZZZ